VKGLLINLSEQISSERIKSASARAICSLPPQRQKPGPSSVEQL